MESVLDWPGNNILYLIYNLLLLLLLPFLLPYLAVRTLLTGRYRMGIMERFGFIDSGRLRRLEGKTSIWLHAVSVGEVNASIPLINRLQESYPKLKIVVSTVTVTGYENALKKIPSANMIFFFPLDLSCVVRRVVKRLRPKIFIVMETEIWPNILKILHDSGIPSILVNGRVSSVSFRRYKIFRFFFKGVLRYISCLSMQSDRDSRRIIELGAGKEKVLTSGNIKFEQTVPSMGYENVTALYREFALTTNNRLFIAGSTHPGEEEIILNVFGSLKEEFPSLKLILAPRHPERFKEVDDLVRSKGFSLLRKTDLDRGETYPFDVILLDTIGELKNTYGLASIIFVGGSLVKKGGHNLLEPASYGKPVFFGPYTDNFSHIAKVMIEGGGGIRIKDGDDLLYQARRFLSNPSSINKAGNSALKVLKAGQGALDKNMKLIDSLLKGTYNQKAL